MKELGKANARLKKLVADQALDNATLKEARLGKLLSPTRRRAAVQHVRNALGPNRVSERRACRVLNQPRSTQRREKHMPNDEPRLIRRIVQLASEYGRCWIFSYQQASQVLDGYHNRARMPLQSRFAPTNQPCLVCLYLDEDPTFIRPATFR